MKKIIIFIISFILTFNTFQVKVDAAGASLIIVNGNNELRYYPEDRLDGESIEGLSFNVDDDYYIVTVNQDVTINTLNNISMLARGKGLKLVLNAKLTINSEFNDISNINDNNVIEVTYDTGLLIVGNGELEINCGGNVEYQAYDVFEESFDTANLVFINAHTVKVNGDQQNKVKISINDNFDYSTMTEESTLNLLSYSFSQDTSKIQLENTELNIKAFEGLTASGDIKIKNSICNIKSVDSRYYGFYGFDYWGSIEIINSDITIDGTSTYERTIESEAMICGICGEDGEQESNIKNSNISIDVGLENLGIAISNSTIDKSTIVIIGSFYTDSIEINDSYLNLYSSLLALGAIEGFYKITDDQNCGAIFRLMSEEGGAIYVGDGTSEFILNASNIYCCDDYDGTNPLDSDLTLCTTSLSFDSDSTNNSKFIKTNNIYYVEYVTNCEEVFESEYIFKKPFTPNVPSNGDLIFDGWYVDSNFHTKFVPGTTPSSDLTLYAKWTEEDPTPTPTPTPDPTPTPQHNDSGNTVTYVIPKTGIR